MKFGSTAFALIVIAAGLALVPRIVLGAPGNTSVRANTGAPSKNKVKEELPVNATPGTKSFEVTAKQIEQLRKLIVGWAEVEAGAPGVDYVQTFGMNPDDEDPGPQILQWLGVEPSGAGGHYTPEQQSAGMAQFQSLEKAFEILLSAGEIKPGHYSFKNHGKKLFPHGGYFFDGKLVPVPEGETVEFDLTAEHLKLVRRANTTGLFIDPKRPYGDMTFFEIDMADALGIPYQRKSDGTPDFSKQQMEHFAKLHTDMMPVVQIMLLRAHLVPGRYALDSAGTWHRALD